MKDSTQRSKSPSIEMGVLYKAHNEYSTLDVSNDRKKMKIGSVFLLQRILKIHNVSVRNNGRIQ